MHAPSLTATLLGALLAFAPATTARAEGERVVTHIEVDVDRPRAGEREQLARYLRDLAGAPAVEATADRAEQKLLRLSRYRSAVCRVSERDGGARLKCGLSRARTIRSVRIEGLPMQLLETDLRKRIFLRPGEVLDRADASGRDRVSRQRERIEEYLERQGFYGARVDVLTPPVSRTADVDVEVRIKGGSFVRVRRVEVEAWLPLDRSELKSKLAGMCSSAEGILGAFDTGELACYTRDRLRELVERFERRVREKGFPEGRIQVQAEQVDPLSRPSSEGDCYASDEQKRRFAEDRLPVPPRCVDLKVRVRPGPRLVPVVVLHEEDDAGAVADEPLRPPRRDAFTDAVDLGLGAVRDGVLNLISRIVQPTLGLDLQGASDTFLSSADLLRVLTFSESRSTDETEAEVSRAAIKDALARRGYFAARVEMTRTEVDEERVEVRYDIWPGPPLAIGSVRLEGVEAFSVEQLQDEVELAARERAVHLLEGGFLRVDDGFVTQSDLNDDVVRLRSFYERHGYRDANVSWRVTQSGPGQLQVTFTVDEGDSVYRVAGVRLIGGVPELGERVLGAIKHCESGLALTEDRKPSVPDDCRGNPLLPDELEADGQRVLNVYAAAGYPYAKARVGLSPDWTDEGPYVEIRVEQTRLDEAEGAEAEPPPPVRVERGVVFIEGNTKTDRGVILKEMGIDEGSSVLLDPVEISKSVSRLRRTGVFSRVSFDYVGLEEQSEQVHLLLQLEERPTLTLDTALGFSTDNLFVTRVEVRDRNFLGWMLDVGFLMDFGLFVGRSSQAQLKLRWPRILGSDVDFTLQPGIVYSDVPSHNVPRAPGEDGPVEGVPAWQAPDLRRRILSGGLTAGLQWRVFPEVLPGLVAGVSYELGVTYDNPAALRIPVFSERAFTTLDGLLEVFDAEPQRFGILSPHIAYSSITNPFDPSEGWTGELGLRLGGPLLLGEESFFLATGRATAYFSLTAETTLAVNGRAWWGMSLLDATTSDDKPPSVLLSPDLIYLGGDRTVRGFSAEDPFGLDPNVARSAPLTVAGGQLNLELRQTLLKDLFLGDLKGAIFVDAGLVTDTLQLPWLDPLALYDIIGPPPPGVSEEECREQGRCRNLFGASVGVGLRYVLPVGPMSFDVAFSPTHQRYGFHFQFGYAF